MTLGMREFILILAISPLCVFAQPVTPPPPPELDRAVNQNPLHFSDRIAILPTDLNRLDADYSEEGRIAGLEGTVRLTAVVAEDGRATGIQVTEPLTARGRSSKILQLWMEAGKAKGS
jgi:hypothetical protein